MQYYNEFIFTEDQLNKLTVEKTRNFYGCYDREKRLVIKYSKELGYIFNFRNKDRFVKAKEMFDKEWDELTYDEKCSVYEEQKEYIANYVSKIKEYKSLRGFNENYYKIF